MSRILSFVFLSCLALVLYHAALGPHALALLDPRQVSWLLQKDWAFSFFTLQSFLSSNWSWPIGSFTGYLFSSPINLLLGDAIPFWSLLAKLIHGRTGEFLQFTGAWFLFCCILQTHAASLLARIVYRQPLLVFFSTCGLSFAPFLIHRIGHPALFAQFLILYGMAIVLKSRDSSTLKSYGLMLGLILLSAGIHPYFPPMLIILGAAIPFTRQNARKGKGALLEAGLFFLAAAATAGATFYALGARSTPIEEIKPISFYTSDVFIFLNSMNQARILPAAWLPRMGQTEAYSYLGLGWCLLLGMSCYFAFRKRRSLKAYIKASSLTPLFLGCLLLFFWSLGENVRFFGQWLISLHALYEPFYPVIGSLRSAGRFAWPLAYFLLLFLPMIVAKLSAIRPRTYRWILTALFALQFIDVSKPWFHAPPTPEAFNLPDEARIKPLLALPLSSAWLLPPDLVNTPCRNPQLKDESYISLAYFAHAHGLSFNSGNRANPPYAPAIAYCQEMEKHLQEKNWRADILYIFAKASPAEFSEGLSCIEEAEWRYCRR